MWNKIFVFFLLTFSSLTMATEELVVVQTVSKTGKTFVIRKGRKDGVNLGQESLFTTNAVSLSAKVKESTRDYSLWEVTDKKLEVPFEKDQIVNFTNTVENIYAEIPMLRHDPKLKSQEAFERDKKGFQGKIRPYKWIFRGSLSYTLSQTITQTDANLESSRSGVHLEGQYILPLHERIDTSFGLRIDQENTSQTEANLDIPSRRIMAVGEVTFNWEQFEGTLDYMYLGVGAGIGTSQTEVNQNVSTGSATLLPVVRLGYHHTMSQNYALIVEGVAESISANEQFDSGIDQKTNNVNLKLSAGFKF